MNLPKSVPLAFLLIYLSCPQPVPAQGTAEDYHRASQIRQTYARALRGEAPAYFWSGSNLILKSTSNKQTSFQKIDTATGAIEPVDPDDWTKTPLILSPESRWRASANSSSTVDITFVNKFDKPVRLFWVDGKARMKAYGVIEAGNEKNNLNKVRAPLGH